MKLFALDIPCDQTSPFVSTLKAATEASPSGFEWVKDPATADIILPDMDLDAAFDPDFPDKLVQYLLHQPAFSDPENRARTLLLSAIPDFPAHRFPDFRFLSFATGSPNFWFSPDLPPVSDTRRPSTFCIQAPDRFSRDFRLLTSLLPLAAPSRTVDPLDVGLEPALIASALVSSAFFIAPPPSLRGLHEQEIFFFALAAGCVPILIGDRPLPGDPHIDYRAVVLRVLNDPTSAATIHHLAATMPDSERLERSNHARRLHLRHLAAANALPRLHDLFSLSHPGPHPAPPASSDRQDSLVTFFRFLWRRVALEHGPDARMAIYGCGKMLHILLTELLKTTNAPALTCIIDDKPPQATILGCPVLPPDRAPPLDLIMVGSDFHEDSIRDRAASLFPPPIRILGTSDFLPAAGLTKAGYWALPRPPDYLSTVLPNRYTGSLPTQTRRSLGRVLTKQPVPPQRIRKLEAVMVCVGYSDFLQWTLPLNVRHFDRFVVVTSSTDTSTQQVARQCGATLVVSDSYRDGDATFNKGKMMNVGLAALDGDGWILFTDADIILPDTMRADLARLTLDRDNLYFAGRFNIPAANREAWLDRYSKTREGLDRVSFVDCDPCGYFQLFSPQAAPLRSLHPRLCSEDFLNAGGVDMHFFRMWQKSPDGKLARTAISVLHIPHGPLGSNWAGRQSAPLASASAIFAPAPDESGKWTQVAYIVSSGRVDIRAIPQGGYIKFTRCDTGECIVFKNTDTSPRLVSGTNVVGIPQCGVCSGLPGDVTLALDHSGAPLSGWGIGTLIGTNVSARVWNHKRIGHADFDILHKDSLSPEDIPSLLPGDTRP